MANKFLQLIPQKQMQFAPVPEDDDDDLSRSIKDDPITREDNWDLTDDIDAEKLDKFWDDALRESGAAAPEDAR
ncbi:MAG TPA: hypothetical protein VFT87_01300 [Candidatus Saccharimonadales bacterium]|nr:hypothetical protein [Candidatus Saccharimonadales bacterium]